MEKNTPDRQPTEPEDPGIAWMFQSSRVSDQELCAALIQEHSAEICRSAEELASRPGQARQIALFTLATAVAERHRYWGTVQLQEWLDEKVKRCCEDASFLEKGPTEQHPGQPILPTEQEILHLAFEFRLRHRRKTGLLAGLLIALVLAVTAGSVWWLTSINEKTASLQPGQYWFTYTYYPQQIETYESIALKAGISAEEIRRLNQSSGEEQIYPGIPVKLPAYVPDWWNQPAPKRAEKPPAPLSLSSTAEEIKQRLLNSDRYWSTLWLEYQMFYYGIPGYMGTANQAQRIQIWIRQPDIIRLIVITGEGNTPGTALYEGPRAYFFEPSQNQIGAYFLTEAEKQEIRNYLFRQSYFSEQLSDLRIAGSEMVAGRQALVVDLLNSHGQRTDRLWIDQNLGLILNHYIYGGRGHNVVTFAQTTTKLSVDAKFPTSIFDLTQKVQAFAQDPSGRPEVTPSALAYPDFRFGSAPRLPKGFQTPPPGFDPSHSQLMIFWPNSPSSPEMATPGPPVDRDKFAAVYLDQYTLGYWEVGSLNFVFCARSPDGKWAAISARENNSNSGSLLWFRLDRTIWMDWMNQSQHIGVDFSPPGSFAFLSDGLLAYHGCTTMPYRCGLFLFDMETQEEVSYYHLQLTGNPVAWSPDGEYLAHISPLPVTSSEASVQQNKVNIMRVRSGEIVYNGSYDPQTKDNPAGIPGWDEILIQDVAGCALP
jgi:hypothetical protein